MSQRDIDSGVCWFGMSRKVACTCPSVKTNGFGLCGFTITFGDNDILAALLARCMDVDLLVMLSYTVEGLGKVVGYQRIL